MRTLYRPLSLMISVLSALFTRTVVKRVWRRLGGESKTPRPTDRRFNTWQVVGAGAVQGAFVGAVRAAVDRAGAATYAKATGAWPGDE